MFASLLAQVWLAVCPTYIMTYVRQVLEARSVSLFCLLFHCYPHNYVTPLRLVQYFNVQILLALNPHARVIGCTYGNVGLQGAKFVWFLFIPLFSRGPALVVGHCVGSHDTGQSICCVS